MDLRPLGDRVVVRPTERQEMTAAGIVLPETAQRETQRGVVLMVGEGPRSPWTGEVAKMNIAAGDEIVFSRHAGTELSVDGEDLLVLREPDIVAVVSG